MTAAILILRLSFPGIRFFPVPESIGFIRQMTIRDRSPFLYSVENTSMQEIIGSWRNIPRSSRWTCRPEAVDVRFTYDIDGILLADIRVVSTGHTISSVVSQTVDDERLQARMKELEKLKVHPREVTENKLLLNRLMTLCEESSPKDREYFTGLIALFEKTPKIRIPERSNDAGNRFRRALLIFPTGSFLMILTSGERSTAAETTGKNRSRRRNRKKI